MREDLLKKIIDLLAKKGTTNSDLSQTDILDGMLSDEGIGLYKVISKKDLGSNNTYTRLLSACVDMDIIRQAGTGKAARYAIGHLGYICLWAIRYPKTEIPANTALKIEISVDELAIHSALKFYSPMYVLPIWGGVDTLLREYLTPTEQNLAFSENTILLRDAGLIIPEEGTKTSATKYKTSKTGKAIIDVLNQILFSKNPPLTTKP